MHVACNFKHPEKTHQTENPQEAQVNREERQVKRYKGHKVNNGHRGTHEFQPSCDRVFKAFIFNNGVNAAHVFDRKKDYGENFEFVKEVGILLVKIFDRFTHNSHDVENDDNNQQQLKNTFQDAAFLCRFQR